MPDDNWGIEILMNGAVCTGRNGTFDIIAVQVCTYSNLASIEAVGKSKRVLNAGFYAIPAEKMDELCKRWLIKRGLLNE